MLVHEMRVRCLLERLWWCEQDLVVFFDVALMMLTIAMRVAFSLLHLIPSLAYVISLHLLCIFLCSSYFNSFLPRISYFLA